VGLHVCASQFGAVHHRVVTFATPSFEFQAAVSACILLRRYLTDVVLTFSSICVLVCLCVTQVYQVDDSTTRKNGRRYYRNYCDVTTTRSIPQALSCQCTAHRARRTCSSATKHMRAGNNTVHSKDHLEFVTTYFIGNPPLPSSTDCTHCIVSRYSLPCGRRNLKWSSLSEKSVVTMGTARLQFSNVIVRNWWSDVLLKILNHLTFLFCLNTLPRIIYSAMHHFSLPPLLQMRGIRARAFGKLVWRAVFFCCGYSVMDDPSLLFSNLE